MFTVGERKSEINVQLSGIHYSRAACNVFCSASPNKEKSTFSINFSGRHRNEIYDAPKTAVKIWRAAPRVSKFCPPILVKKIFLFASRILDFFSQYPKGKRDTDGAGFPRVAPGMSFPRKRESRRSVLLPFVIPRYGFRLQYLQ